MAQQRKSAADFGQLSLFAEVVPQWLQPAEPPQDMEDEALAAPESTPDEDDDLSQFNHWLQQNRRGNSQNE